MSTRNENAKPPDAAEDAALVEEVRKKAPAVTRRGAAIGLGSTAAMLVLGGMRYAIPHNPVPRPPGGQSEAALVSACIRCERCFEACPRDVIIPCRIEDGLLGMRSPQLVFKGSPGDLPPTNYCDFCAEANDGHPRCVEVCPTNALHLDEGATAQSTIIGTASIDTSTCLAYRDTGCRFCYDACIAAGHTAIQLEQRGDNPRPSVDASLCNGCGACESVCVSLSSGSIAAGATERAITVKPA